MRHILTIAVAALTALACPAAAQTVDKGPDHDPIVEYSESDKAMNAAKAKGQGTLTEFFRHYAAPARDESSFAIKFDLLPEPDAAEFIWATIVSRRGGIVVTTLDNDPRDPRFERGETVRVPEDEVVDWAYFKGNVMQGSFTTRVMLETMPPEEAEPIRKALGW